MRRSFGPAEHRDFVLGAIERLFANNPDGAQADLGFAAQPAAELRRLRGRADEQRFLVTQAENSARQKMREKMMRKEKRDVEPGDKIEKENTRDERVLRRDEIKDERADAGDRLAKREPMLPEQLGLQENNFLSPRG